jgi:hypothetical protein
MLGLAGHFGVKKILDMLSDHFFWPYMRCDVQRHVERCITCLKAKSRLNPHGLYTPLPNSECTLGRYIHGFYSKFTSISEGEGFYFCCC